jgi:hypothetical protein
MRLSFAILVTAAACALAPGLAGAVPSFFVNAGASGSNTIGGCIVSGTDGTSTTPNFSQRTCIGDPNGTGQATARTFFGHVGASADAQTFGLSGTSAFAAFARYLDSVVFTGPPGGLIPVSLNLDFSGALNAASGSGEVRMSITIGGNGVGNFREVIDGNGVVAECINSFGIGCGNLVIASVTTSSVLVPVDVDVPVELGLAVFVGATGISGSASVEFLNSLDFPIGRDLFNLPDGFTVNAPGSFIVNNRFVPTPSEAAPVPGPSALVLVGIGLGGLAFLRRRRAA